MLVEIVPSVIVVKSSIVVGIKVCIIVWSSVTLVMIVASLGAPVVVGRECGSSLKGEFIPTPEAGIVVNNEGEEFCSVPLIAEVELLAGVAETDRFLVGGGLATTPPPTVVLIEGREEICGILPVVDTGMEEVSEGLSWPRTG
jgi:hypothetical protein